MLDQRSLQGHDDDQGLATSESSIVYSADTPLPGRNSNKDRIR